MVVAFKVCKRKSEEAYWEGLKCLHKELLVALSKELKLFWSCFYWKHVITVISPKNAFNRVSTISSF